MFIFKNNKKIKKFVWLLGGKKGFAPILIIGGRVPMKAYISLWQLATSANTKNAWAMETLQKFYDILLNISEILVGYKQLHLL